MALGLGEDAAWIERVIDETAPPGTGLGAGALESLRQVLGEAGADDALLAQLEEDPGLMARRLPAALRGATRDPVLRALLDGDTVALVARVAEDLVARLAVEG
jgi:DNA repair protein SbcD/Mre11